MKTSFGLDLSGYSSRGSALARATRCDDGAITVTICRDCCFAAKTKGHYRLATVNEAELEFIRARTADDPLIVDVPIDLQGLPSPATSTFVWELIRRPVDRAFGALPPLADQIGAYVARMQRLWSILHRDGNDPLDTSLFETYPAACLELMGLERKGYKGRAMFDGTQWLGCSAEDKQEQKKCDKLAHILTSLGWVASSRTVLSHDEFDAAICALVGIATETELLSEKKLQDSINERLRTKNAVPKKWNPLFSPPRGYRLLAQSFKRIYLDALQQ